MSLLRVVTAARRSGLLASKSMLPRAMAARQMSDKLPDVMEHTVGKEKLELEAEEQGYEYFNKYPITTTEAMGNSKDDPIFVPSYEDVRPVGISHNDSSYMTWFNLSKGKVHFIPQFGKYFKLVSMEEYVKVQKVPGPQRPMTAAE